MSAFKKFYLLSLTGLIIACAYPIYMGIKVVWDMLNFGTVYAESYPKYVIPYAPVAVALIVGIAIMPLMFRFAKKFTMLAGSAISVALFFAAELLLESQAIVTTTVRTTLESWQMYMCYVPPEGYQTRTWTAVDVLIGEYSPAFKIHFYLISVILILSVLNCFYGFAKMILTGNRGFKKVLITQAISSIVFLGLCIFACFTAFFRTGEISVSPLSAFLMVLFFIIMDVNCGIYAGSFMLGRRNMLSVVLPSVLSSLIVSAMYAGEMVLLSGNLYRLGRGFFFDGLGKLVLAPADMAVILFCGIITALVLFMLNRKKIKKTAEPAASFLADM